MFQYVLALLLINTYYQSLGNPIPPVNITNSLLALEMQCENKFVSDQIHSNIQDCNITVSPYMEQQCLMFYDINKQLCSAVAASRLALNEDYAAKIKEYQDINTFCTSAKGFTFTYLTEYPVYKHLAERIFNASTACGKVCGYSDFANEDTMYFCKYFKWGLSMMQNLTTVPSSIVSNDTVFSVSEADTSNADIHVNALNSNPKTPNIQLKPIAPKVPSGVDTLALPTDDKASEATMLKTSTKSPKITAVDDKGDNKNQNIDIDNELVKDPSISSIDQGISQTKQNETNIEKIILVSDIPGPEADKEAIGNTGSKDSVIENPAKLKPEEDDMDSEEEPVGQGEDDDTLGQEHDVIEQQYPVKNTLVISEKEYARTDADEYSGDGDNFFPFFLTAVVLVVLLYVLYHNKNKVTKVFFGLVLEGRGGSRRRNSRGHAYRRLDTLEQAMSAQTAMPPSKIIY